MGFTPDQAVAICHEPRSAERHKSAKRHEGIRRSVGQDGRLRRLIRELVVGASALSSEGYDKGRAFTLIAIHPDPARHLVVLAIAPLRLGQLLTADLALDTQFLLGSVIDLTGVLTDLITDAGHLTPHDDVDRESSPDHKPASRRQQDMLRS